MLLRAVYIDNSNVSNDLDKNRPNLENDNNLSTMSNSKQSPWSNASNETKKNELKRGFKIAHLNVRILVKNIDQLRIYLQDQQFDVISINETTLAMIYLERIGTEMEGV